MIERSEVILPREFRFPLTVKDYLSWVEPSGFRVYLLFQAKTGSPALGIVFRRDQTGTSTQPRMCEWCHAVRAGDGVSMLTATASSHRSVGLHLCRDLSCKEKAVSAPGVHDVPQSITSYERVQKIIQKMNEFARRELF